VAFAAARGKAEHLRAGVDADDKPVRADVLDKLGAEEPRPTTNIENTLTRCGGQGFTDQASPLQRIADPVQLLELLPSLLVENELAHKGRLIKAFVY